jgi:parallel beta-helix repeat protein
MGAATALMGAVLFVLPAASYGQALVVKPGPDAQDDLQEALIAAKPGQIVRLAAGVFHLTDGLSLDVANVTVRGAGMNKSVLSFKGQEAGGEGLLVTSSGVTLADFAVEDAKGDAIKVNGADGISMLRLRVEWTGGPKESNGAYGLYPVSSSNVLIDGCVAIGASDAGIYVGQSRNIIVRNSRAEQNVAGIEIENSYDADVYDNVATHNTGGILVFDLPDLPQQGGHNIRVFRNRSVDNDTPNFAPEGNIVGMVPKGTGMLIMANRNVEIFENEIGGNGTANLMITSYYSSGLDFDDDNYQPIPKAIHVHNNRFGKGGWDPVGDVGTFISGISGKPVPDIVWDGVKPLWQYIIGVPDEDRIVIHDNGDAGFMNLDALFYTIWKPLGSPSRDLADHEGALPSLPPVTLPGA